MRKRWRGAALVVALAFLALGSVCEDEDVSVPGTYELRVRETLDTCDQELNVFGSQLTISRGAEGFVLDFGEDATLSGDFDDEGVLVAQGTIEDLGDGKTTFMQLGLVLRRGEITQGTGRLTFNGTFPGVSGQCVQEFVLDGQKLDSATPIVG